MASQTDSKKETKDKNTADNQELILQLEKQVSIALWIQFIGQIMEAILLSKIASISEEVRSDPNERQIIQGAWFQTIGQFMESMGATQQVMTTDENIRKETQNITTLGDWIQAVGTVLEAHGGSQIIVEEEKRESDT
ncbi:hypothetical protein [Bacillus litorisediminis]|uniref:hypothetical protein n=1 Tax=Bacillus litorisediminis TaxID=2922713 RepID=UPI001FAFBC48|nr:hypothetical protein [Bacillus litorisediminis]